MERVSELAARLVAFYTFEAGEVPPQIDRFYDAEGITAAEFSALLEVEEFRCAYDEARRRYFDTLTAGALIKKYDPSFVKHLLDIELRREVAGRQGRFDVEIRVVP